MNFIKRNLRTVITTILIGHFVTTWTFPVFFELKSLNGTNGFKINGESDGVFSGYSVSYAGDINGDGIDDLIIGAPFSDSNGKHAAGSCYVLFGHNQAWTSSLELDSLDGTNGFKINGESGNDFSGYSVSNAGDINHDGIDDLIIGAIGVYIDGQSNVGSSYVVFGHASPWASPLNLSSLNSTNGFVINGESSGSNSGFSVSNAGDINGDGIDDIIIGCRFSGSNYVVFGHDNQTWTSPLELSSLNGTNGFKITGKSGCSVSYAGDINNDGIDDLVIGIYQSGFGYVIFGHESSWTSPLELDSLNGTNGFKIYGQSAGSDSCWSVSNAGDINHDGIDDIIIGNPSVNIHGQSNVGSSYVVFGHASPWTSLLELDSLNGTNGFVINGEAHDDESGCSVSYAGDINHDGIDDIIIGAHFTKFSGSGYVIFGHDNHTWTSPLELSSLNGVNGCKINGEAGVGDETGFSVSNAGDINHDGIDDFIISDPKGQSLAGSCYVVFGSINHPPVIVVSESSISYIENSPPIIIDSDITINDDQLVIYSASISITNNFNPEQDILSFVNQNCIVGNYNSETGKMILTGISSLSNYQIALRNVTYQNTDDDPSTGVRAISFIVNDGVAGDSLPATRNIIIIPINQPPVITGSGGSFNYKEKDPPVIIDSAITISDADNTTLANANISITNNFNPEQDILSFVNQNCIVGNYNSETGKMILTGISSLSNYQIALRSVTYQNNADVPPTGPRSIYFLVSDGILNSNTIVRNIIVLEPGTVIDNESSIKEKIIAGCISGFVGLLFFVIKLYINYKANQSFEKAAGTFSTTMRRQQDFERNILKPVCNAIFERINIKGFLGYIDDNTMMNYLDAIMLIIEELDKRGIDIDFEKMRSLDQNRLVNEIAKQAKNNLLPEYNFCSCDTFIHYSKSFFKADVTAEQFEDKAEEIALAVAEALNKRNTITVAQNVINNKSNIEEKQNNDLKDEAVELKLLLKE